MPGEPLYVPNPLAGFPAQDFIRIGGIPNPGKATITKISAPHGWDIRKGYGLSGATVVPTGDELGDLEILFELWDPNDYPKWNLFAKQFLQKALVAVPGGLVAMALSIDHPVITEMGKGSYVLKDRSGWTNDGFGLWSSTAAFLEYKKPKPALPRPLAAIPAAAAPVPTAQDAQDVQIQQVLAAVKLAAGK